MIMQLTGNLCQMETQGGWSINIVHISDAMYEAKPIAFFGQNNIPIDKESHTQSHIILDLIHVNLVHFNLCVCQLTNNISSTENFNPA